MPYISTEEVKAKRKEIKAAFPEYKISVTKENCSTVCVSIMEGPAEMPTDPQNDRLQVNHYYIERHHAENPEAVRVFSIIKEIAERGMSTGHDDSDYGYVPGHYVSINVGKWDKPYTVKGS